MSKKFEELRPFDLEAAKAGAPICYMDGDIPSSWFIHDDVLYVEWSNEPERFVQFKADTGLDRWCMAPLCWVEDRPVYKGDVLWNKLYPAYRYDVARFENGRIYSLQNETYSHCEDVENLTWVGPTFAWWRASLCVPVTRCGLTGVVGRPRFVLLRGMTTVS